MSKKGYHWFSDPLEEYRQDAQRWNNDPVFRKNAQIAQRRKQQQDDFARALKQWHHWDDILPNGNRYPKPTLLNPKWRPNIVNPDISPKVHSPVRVQMSYSRADPQDIAAYNNDMKRIEDNRVAALKRKRASQTTPLTKIQKEIIETNYKKVAPMLLETDCKNCREFILDNMNQVHRKCISCGDFHCKIDHWDTYDR